MQTSEDKNLYWKNRINKKATSAFDQFSKEMNDVSSMAAHVKQFSSDQDMRQLRINMEEVFLAILNRFYSTKMVETDSRNVIKGGYIQVDHPREPQSASGTWGTATPSSQPQQSHPVQSN